ncbi:hypothetical protein RB195_012780 [Necator americanus]|uniref:Phlebovirus glycoprotein G2 fusion domain-containing protein n=1 Tax=Necator americanus TaxID=51031 RepID=A0ABR1DSP5_NECAM
MKSMESLIRNSANRVENRQCLTGAADELHGATLVDPTTDIQESGTATTDCLEERTRPGNRETFEIKIDINPCRSCVPELLIAIGVTSTISTLMVLSTIILKYYF